VDLSKVPDTYVPPEPFVAYRAWNWTTEGVTSLNGAVWTPKEAFEARCPHVEDLRSMKAAAPNTPAMRAAKAFWDKQTHLVPDPDCTCGMYAGLNMKHLLDIGYIRRGIHGEVHLWGRLYRHSLGWRAQYAYPKNFIVPTTMIPFRFDEAQKRLAALIEFDVNIYVQSEREAHVGQQTIPLWIRDYGYSAQGIDFLVEKRLKSYTGEKAVHTLAVGDRVAVLGDGGGIGIVTEIKGDDMSYTMFNPSTIYRKPTKSIQWNERNWRWETSGVGSMRKLKQAMVKRA
jgi:hypothetical protein